jgi:hypothetical protein
MYCLKFKMPSGAVELFRPCPLVALEDLQQLLAELALVHRDMGGQFWVTVGHPAGENFSRRILGLVPLMGGGYLELERLLSERDGLDPAGDLAWGEVLEALLVGRERQPAQLLALHQMDGERGQSSEPSEALPPEDNEGRTWASLLLIAGGQGAVALAEKLSAGQINALFSEYAAVINPDGAKLKAAGRALAKWQAENQEVIWGLRSKFLGDLEV